MKVQVCIKVRRRSQRYVRDRIKDEVDLLKKIIVPFVVRGICKDEAEAFRMLTKDYVRRQVQRYDERVAHFRAFYQSPVEQFAQRVTALCQGSGEISVLGSLDKREQIQQAEDDLEEWQGAEQFLAHWQAVEADLQNASTA